MIKYNVKTVNDWLYNSNPIKKLYYNGTMRYRRFVANGSPTPPTPPSFDGKFKAEYSDGTSYSAACDGNTELTTTTTKPSDYYYTAMTSCEIGDCITSIGQAVFQSFRSLSSVTFGSSLTTIGKSAFNGCRSLSNITIPDNVTQISDSAFQNCTGLTSVTIGNNMASIGQRAFNGCRSLSSVTCLPTTPPTIVGTDTFHNTSSNLVIYVPSQSLEAYKNVWSQYASIIQPIS